jgi:branched-chain amino acid aminotransferase
LKLWLNGALRDAEDACIPPEDRGLLLGDGVFETLRSHARRLVTLAAHLERLEAGARVVEIRLPAKQDLAAAVLSVFADTGPEDVRMRITVTAGSGPPGALRGEADPTVLVTAALLEPWPETASAVLAPWPMNESSPLAGVKTTSRGETVLALAHARQQGADETLFRNTAGNLCEAATANVFAVRRGRVETPPLSAGCLAGITREEVLKLCAPLGIEALERDLRLEDLLSADEAFLTSSTRGIQALAEVDGRSIGTHGDGTLTRRLAGELERALESKPDY